MDIFPVVPVFVYERNIQVLATEMCEVSKGMSPHRITKLFAWRNEHPYNLRHNTKFLQPFANSVCFGTESISYLGPKIWGMVPVAHQNIDKMETWKLSMQNL